MTCAVILGTRPEITKLAPVLWALREQAIPHALIHTGQHYSYEMDKVFFEALELAPPAVNLAAGEAGASHGAQTGAILQGIEQAFFDLAVDKVIVHGDTNSTLAGALAGAKLNLPVGHVESGLRSYDRTMPEEVNRVVVDHVATHLWAPTAVAVENLAREGLRDGVRLTGNTIVDTVHGLRPRLAAASFVDRQGLTPGRFIYLTLHRQENTDQPERLGLIVAGLRETACETGLPLVFSMHYRTQERLARAGLTDELAAIPGLRLLHPPVGLLASLELQLHAALVLTDSGGLQEEACILGTPCVTIRENTERPETLAIGSNVLAGYRPAGILAAVRQQLGKPGDWPNPFGDGLAARRCLASLLELPGLDPGPLAGAGEGEL